ncbi:glycoside hydrolase [Alteromonas sediminis]|uniref:Glycoside hydrolase n=1 Tax=Alteromonas sediminis TaxID=2259342 RepID=A0A3N5Y2C8_9ALTE|nr:isoamylase early set domain-containing protein [Alteromonas sediminis]RPJ67500.1 glycoside hydrolase [Alteromonas sediminis]
MSLKKSYLKSKPVCKVTFRLSSEEAKAANSVKLVGEFNDWDDTVSPMKKLKSGEFTQTVDLEVGKNYQFRYLLNESEWENDWHADAYVPNGMPGEDNSVVSV